jgi:hypothetical protein
MKFSNHIKVEGLDAYFLPKCRAIAIALLPFMKPTTCDTEYFGGIPIHMCM